MIFVLEIVVIALASCGFTLALYIHTTKKTPGALVCPMEGSCDTVVHSDYGKLFGMHVEMLGMAYYLSIGLVYTLFAFAPTLMPETMAYITIGITITSFLFSLYLTSVQAFVLKHWCTWCLFSALICTLILILTLYIWNQDAFAFITVFMQ